MKCNKTINFDEHYYAYSIEAIPFLSFTPLGNLRVRNPLADNLIVVDGI
jgi:hypothetical protein